MFYVKNISLNTFINICLNLMINNDNSNSNSNFYKLLNIDNTSNIHTIKNAYRKFSLNYYSNNINNISSEIFNTITQTYQLLLNEPYRPLVEYISSQNHCTNNTNDTNNTNNTNDINNTNGIMIYDNSDDIEIVLAISFENSYNGANLPINISRIIINNNIKKNEKETLYIQIPKGIDHNEIIIVNNKGNCYNHKYSNVKITINLLEHNIFYRNGLDIIHTIDITFKKSLTGFNYVFKHINNKHYKIFNNDGEIIHNNSEKIFYKLGFERDDFYGNLIMKFNITYPTKLPKSIIDKLYEIL